MAMTTRYEGTTVPSMAKEKVTLTLDSANVAELRTLVGARSLSAAVDEAVTAHLRHLRHLRAVDEWLAEMDAEYGPVPPEIAAWGDEVVAAWSAGRQPPAGPGAAARQ